MCQNNSHKLTNEQILQLRSQGCLSKDWSRVQISHATDLTIIHNTRFYGDITIGVLNADTTPEEGIYNAVIKNCTIGDNVFINNIGGELSGCSIGNRVRIDNVGRIIYDREAACGQGVAVGVLDETGSRPVYIYPGISAQMASLMAYKPKWTEDVLFPLLQDYFMENPLPTAIGDDAEITDAVCIENVSIDKEVKIQGVQHLKNGAIINNAPKGSCLAYVGIGVDAENFIIEDAEVSTGATLRNCYVGQGAAIVKGFTAHDSLFFANSACENGEACAIFAGPYTVSMHKSSLLIGGQYSFMNAGSGTNSSNHMYKLGPVHWGIMQRGVKTSSDAYMMWGGRIGAFSLLMGSHKTHPDTSEFPFSYLFSGPTNETIVTPGVMLKSCGLKRDETKWPARDKRVKYRLPKNDNICFDVLNPAIIATINKAIPLLKQISQSEIYPDGFHRFNGMKFKPSSIAKGIECYRMAILKYLYDKTSDVDMSLIEKMEAEWIDLGGQIITRSEFNQIFELETIEDMIKVFDTAFANYHDMELRWIKWLLNTGWDKEIHHAEDAARQFNEMIEADKKRSREMLSLHNNLLSL